MSYKSLVGVFTMGISIVSFTLPFAHGAEFSLSVLSTGATSREFTDSLYVPDGRFDVSVLDESCIGGLYDVYAFPVDNSAPDNSTPPTNIPLNGYKDQPSNFYQAFGGAGVGRYRIEVTQLLDIPGCTLDNVLEAFVDIRDTSIPPPPPPPPIEEGTGSHSGTGDEGSGVPIEIRGGGASSIQFFLQRSEKSNTVIDKEQELTNTLPPLSPDSRVVQDDLIQQKEVCSDKKTLLVRRYELLNATQTPLYEIPLVKKLTVQIRIKRLLEKYKTTKERNDGILSVMCLLEEKRLMHGSAERTTANGNGLIAFLQDRLVEAYEHE